MSVFFQLFKKKCNLKKLVIRFGQTEIVSDATIHGQSEIELKLSVFFFLFQSQQWQSSPESHLSEFTDEENQLAMLTTYLPPDTCVTYRIDIR